MRLRWTVVVRGCADHEGQERVGLHAAAVDGPVDVVADAPAGTRVRELPGLLKSVCGPLCRVTVDGVGIAPDDVVGRPPLVDGAVLTLTCGDAPPVPQRPPEPTALLELAVVAGPDAGSVHPLNRWRQSAGRAQTNDVVVRDPRLSRTHCELVVGAHGVEVVDRASTNGTRLVSHDLASTDSGDGTDPDEPLRLRLGQECQAAATRLRLRDARPRPSGSRISGPAAPVPAAAGTTAATATSDGTLLLRRAPRTRSPEEDPVIRLPAPARVGRSGSFPVLAVLLPALAAGGLALWTGSAVYLLLAALGPLLVAGSWLTSRRDHRRDGTTSRREHARTCAALRAEAARAAIALAAARRQAMPDAVTLLEDVREGHGHVWERHPDDDDALRLRLGLASPPRSPPGAGARRFLPLVTVQDHEGAVEVVRTEDDLAAVDLRDGALGLVEPSDPSLARLLVGQVAVLVAAGTVQVVPLVAGSSRERWRWLALLPHTVVVASDGSPPPPDGDPGATARWLGDRVDARAGRARDRGPGSSQERPLLVVLDDPDDRLDPADLAWLPGAHRAGVHVIVVAARRGSLPHGCATVVEPVSPDGVDMVVTHLADGSRAGFVADRVAPAWAERVARALAPLRLSVEAGPGAVPDRVGLEELLDLGADAIVARWASSRGDLDVPLGVGKDGLVRLDLARCGPHALVAGTTGSGKSELLRAWLLALATSHPPQGLAMLLVDYKGGATFDELAGLPHTVGVLSDLDGGATTRVLHSLRAEVRRRERLLAAAGARDLAELQDRRRRSHSAADPLPRLLVVVDEFRVLAEEAPDVLTEFVRLAATGRSLGIHLVLATQRPAGVVSADVRANAGLRIALRVQDAAESRDVLDRPDAAWLPAGTPGRAVVVGPGVDETVQAAWVGPRTNRRPTLTVMDAAQGEQPAEETAEQPEESPVKQPDGHPGAGGARPSPVLRVVEQVRRAATASARPDASSPWLPPLPPRIGAPPLSDGSPSDRSPSDRSTVTGDLAGLVLGMTDLPWAQSRGLLRWDPTGDGPALVIGGARSGRSGTLSTAARAAVAAGASVVRASGEDPDDDRTVDLLTALAAQPPLDPSAPPVTASGSPGAPPRLRVLLLVDDADALLEAAADPTAADLLGRLLRSGHRAGIGVMLAGGRQCAASRVTVAARVRLVHRTSHPSDALVAGVPGTARATSETPGRCLVVGLPVEATGTDGDGRGWVEAQVLEPVAGCDVVATSPPPWLPRLLPAALALTDLPTPQAGALPVAVVGPDAEPWCLRPGATRLFLVAGPRASGRSTALRVVAAQARRAGLRVAWLSGAGQVTHEEPPGSRTAARAPVTSGAPATGPQPHDGPDCGPDLLLVDDVDRLDATAATSLERWLSGEGGGPGGCLSPRATVVAAALTDAFADDFRGLAALARRHGHGVVLAAGRTDARNVLGSRDAVQQRTHLPGRGLLVEGGRTRRIHLATTGTGCSSGPSLGQPVTAAPREHYRSSDT